MGLLDKIVKRPPAPKSELAEEAAKRASRIPTLDLPAWAEQCGFEVGRNLLIWGRESDRDALDLAQEAAEGQLALINEMKRRAVGSF